MTDKQIQEAAEKYANKRFDPTRGDLMDYNLTAFSAFNHGASLVMERVRKLENALKLIQTDAAICHDDALYAICDAALEGKE